MTESVFVLNIFIIALCTNIVVITLYCTGGILIIGKLIIVTQSRYNFGCCIITSCTALTGGIPVLCAGGINCRYIYKVVTECRNCNSLSAEFLTAYRTIYNAVIRTVFGTSRLYLVFDNSFAFGMTVCRSVIVCLSFLATRTFVCCITLFGAIRVNNTGCYPIVTKRIIILPCGITGCSSKNRIVIIVPFNCIINVGTLINRTFGAGSI